jgi:hypothetical protein
MNLRPTYAWGKLDIVLRYYSIKKRPVSGIRDASRERYRIDRLPKGVHGIQEARYI